MKTTGRKTGTLSQNELRRRIRRLPGVSFVVAQQLLELSMRLEKKRNPIVRLAGRLIGALPMRYSEHIEYKFFGRRTSF